MVAVVSDERLSAFLESGIFRLDEANAFFLDPVRILNRSYTRFRVSPFAYYSRFFSHLNCSREIQEDARKVSRKRKKRGKEKKQTQTLNSREQMADRRHCEVRLALLKAHEALLAVNKQLEILRNLRNDEGEYHGESLVLENELDFVELRSVFQAPFYEIVLEVHEGDTALQNAGLDPCNQSVVPVFDNLVANGNNVDIEAEFFDHKYVLPKNSCFFMSDITHINNLVPAESDCGFNLIVIDPPWENSSAHQKMKYQTLPNRHFLSLPVNQLTHSAGALVALWVTNREKLRSFVENELFPKWGAKHTATFYWLKVKADGSLIGELDLFHHRPYECLLLGLCPGKETNSEQMLTLNHLPDKQIFISIPGDHSRKPPIGELLLNYVSWSKPLRCIELFSREMLAGWTSWGNEPLHFQDSRYFSRSCY